MNAQSSDSPILVAAVTRNIESFHYQKGTHNLKPPMVKQTKDSLEKAFNDDLNVKGLSILGKSKEDDTTSKSSSISKISRPSNAVSHQSKKEKPQQLAAFPGRVVWKDMFGNANLNLPNTSIMDQVRQLIPHDQCQQMSNGIITIMQRKKEDFY